MNFERAQILNINNTEVYILDVITYKNEKYIYTQEIGEEELLEKYSVYKYIENNNAFERIVDPTKLGTLLALFAENINKDL